MNNAGRLSDCFDRTPVLDELEHISSLVNENTVQTDDDLNRLRILISKLDATCARSERKIQISEKTI